MSRRPTLFALFILFTSNSFGQSDFEKDFKQDILEKIWSVEDSTKKADHENMFVIISQDSIDIAYFNWTEVLVANSCSYTKKELKTCFELSLTSCLDNPEIQFIYGYLSEDKQKLHLFFSDQRILDIEKIREKEGWLPFELFTE